MEMEKKASDGHDKSTSAPWVARKTAAAICLLVASALLLIMLSSAPPSPSPALWVSSHSSVGQEEEADKDGGLLAPAGFDEQSCISRSQSGLSYRRKNEKKVGMARRLPSAHLVARLREQEALQRRCGPGTEAYRRAAERLGRRNGTMAGVDDPASSCKYLVLVPYRGLGNRVLAMASAFLYAMLTGRVLLVDDHNKGSSLAGLFCEPFPETTWFLPPDFPLRDLKKLTGRARASYGNLVAHPRRPSARLPPYVFVDLDHACSYHDKLFFCDDGDGQSFLRREQWLVMRTDGYFVPALFLNPAYEEELGKLFPWKDAVFFLLARYLFHPTNKVWGLVTRFHDSYQKSADERLGIQVRVFAGDTPFKHVLDQILACTSQEHLLPDIVSQEVAPPPSTGGARARSKAVLMTGLNSWYSEKIRERYLESAAAGGVVVSVHQPSHEEHQHFGQATHDMKALAEMYLLSMSDAGIVTSGWSTFGYVAQGLGGLTPWVMFKPENLTVPDPPCRRAMSMEPCMHSPPFYDCRAKRGADTGKLLPHVQHCEDMSWGLKLVQPRSTPSQVNPRS